MIELRSYQVEGVAGIRAAFSRGVKRVLFVLPTGGVRLVSAHYRLSGGFIDPAKLLDAMERAADNALDSLAQDARWGLKFKPWAAIRQFRSREVADKVPPNATA